MLAASDVKLSYGQTVALAGVDLRVPSGAVVALVGASGSGKSSLLYCLAGLLRPSAGEVVVDGRSLASRSDDERADFRREHCGFVFQFAELVPELTLRENISLPLELNRWRRTPRTRRVGELLEVLGLEAHAGRRAAQVSGGQAQRAAVARAIAHRPRYLFADEPTGALDSKNGAVVLDAMLALAREDSTAVVLVTHDMAVAQRADQVVELRDGRVVGGA